MIQIEKVENGYVVKVPETAMQTAGIYVFATFESAVRYLRQYFMEE